MFTHAEKILISASQPPQPAIHNSRKYISHSTYNYQSANPSRRNGNYGQQVGGTGSMYALSVIRFFESKVP
jgi:hypothetical protein